MKRSLSLFCLLYTIVGFSQLNPSFIKLTSNYKNKLVFSYTGSEQTWKVPAGVTEILVDVAGAKASTNSVSKGEKRTKISCKMAVLPGTLFYITVGGHLSNPNEGFQAVTKGGPCSGISKLPIFGSGISAFATATPLSQSNALVISGGVGGSSWAHTSCLQVPTISNFTSENGTISIYYN